MSWSSDGLILIMGIPILLRQAGLPIQFKTLFDQYKDCHDKDEMVVR